MNKVLQFTSGRVLLEGPGQRFWVWRYPASKLENSFATWPVEARKNTEPSACKERFTS